MVQTIEYHIDLGAQVGIIRNREFSAGGRAHRISTGSYSSARPTFDPKTGRIHISTANQPERVEGAGRVNDGTTGDTSPQRRRDTDLP